jgi:segregation and condensation protein B
MNDSEKLMVPDPFENNLSEIAKAQDVTEELDLDEPESKQDREATVVRPRADGSYDLAEVQACAEVMLFLSDKPLSITRMADMLGMQAEDQALSDALALLKERHAPYGSGIELVEAGGGYQLRTKVAYAGAAKRLTKVRTQKLSRGALESLAIVAYKQPVLKDDIDRVRGVDSSHFVRTLLERGLIEIQGRSELPGRPMLYATTQRFLEVFGLMSLSDMPSAHELEEMVPGSEVGQEDPRVLQIRNMLQKLSSEPSAIQYDPAQDEEILAKMRADIKAIAITTPTLEAPTEPVPAELTETEQLPLQTL